VVAPLVRLRGDEKAAPAPDGPDDERDAALERDEDEHAAADDDDAAGALAIMGDFRVRVTLS